jgi:hypothetical protein
MATNSFKPSVTIQLLSPSSLWGCCVTKHLVLAFDPATLYISFTIHVIVHPLYIYHLIKYIHSPYEKGTYTLLIMLRCYLPTYIPTPTFSALPRSTLLSIHYYTTIYISDRRNSAYFYTLILRFSAVT